MSIQHVAVGDQFRDNDPRLPSPRIIAVRALAVDERGRNVAQVETVEHWNEKNVGRHTWVRVERLELGRDRQTGYTKVSR